MIEYDFRFDRGWKMQGFQERCQCRQQDDSDRTPRQGNEGRFHHELSDQTQSARSHRQPDRHRSLPGPIANEQQIGHVQTSDRQDDRDQSPNQSQVLAHGISLR